MANFRLNNIDESDSSGARAVMLEAMQFHVNQIVTEQDFQFLLSATIEERNHFHGVLSGQLVHAMRALVQGMKGKEEVLASELVPVTWMDHLKDAIAKRFPRLDRWIGRINCRKIDTKIQHYSLCPHTHIPKRSDHNVHVEWMFQNSASPGVADLYQLAIPDQETAREIEMLLSMHFITSYGDTNGRLQYAKNYLAQALDNFRHVRAHSVPTQPAKPPGFGDEL